MYFKEVFENDFCDLLSLNIWEIYGHMKMSWMEGDTNGKGFLRSALWSVRNAEPICHWNLCRKYEPGPILLSFQDQHGQDGKATDGRPASPCVLRYFPSLPGLSHRPADTLKNGISFPGPAFPVHFSWTPRPRRLSLIPKTTCAKVIGKTGFEFADRFSFPGDRTKKACPSDLHLNEATGPLQSYWGSRAKNMKIQWLILR